MFKNAGSGSFFEAISMRNEGALFLLAEEQAESLVLWCSRVPARGLQGNHSFHAQKLSSFVAECFLRLGRLHANHLHRETLLTRERR